MIIDKEFIKEENKDEILQVIGSFLNRAEEKGLLKANVDNLVGDNLIFLDKDKFKIVEEMIKDFEQYKN